jgi:AmmeMemoRadiSam system protein A
MNREEDEIILTENEKAVLLSLARQAIIAAVGGTRDVDGVLSGREISEPALNEARGVFVTLKQNESLRGCIGTIHAEDALYRAVVESAISSAMRDPRFPPLTEEEIEETYIEISVLTPFRTVNELEEIEVGSHGLYVQKDHNAGLLLPQVATEWGWNRDEFLEQCCRKAGLNIDAWKEDDTEIMIFRAVVFRENIDA